MRFTIPISDTLEKGYYIGPKGGKWADPDHKIPWKETGPKRTKKVEVKKTRKKGKGDTGSHFDRAIAEHDKAKKRLKAAHQAKNKNNTAETIAARDKAIGDVEAAAKNLKTASKNRHKDKDEGGKKAKGRKYTKRVPYTDKDGKKKYRYYYAESSVARDVQSGETVKLGEQFAEVSKVSKDGTVTMTVGGKEHTVPAEHWDKLLASHYGDTYYKWAEKRAQQSVNAVLKHVPKEDLVDPKGDDDKSRLEDLKKRVPLVFEKLKKSFSRAGVNPFRAKQILAASLERKGWEPEARAAVIGDVIIKRNQNYKTTIQAAENLAGGGPVKVGHVGAVTEIVKSVQNEKKDEIVEVAAAAEKELAKLSALLVAARGGDAKDGAEALAAALSSTAMHKLNMIAKAFPGTKDRAVNASRKAMEQVRSVVPAAKPKTEGSSTVVFVAGEGGNAKALNAKYKLVEADDAIASHDPRSFNKRKDYPDDVQERAYHRDKSEQAKVMRNAQRLRPEFVINTNPDAVNGAPIMGPDGVVLGGNSRTMSIQLAYAKHPEKAKEMKDYLEEHAHEAGFTKEDVAQFKNPMLARVLENGGETKEDKQLLVRQMNESFTQAMDPRTMQVAMGRKITDETLQELGNSMEPDETLNQFLATKRSEPFINALEKAGIIDQRNANQYFMKGTKTLNPDGRTLVSRILVGRAVGDADLLSATKPKIVESLAQSVPYIAQAKIHGEGFDLSKDLNMALDAYNSLQYRVDTKSIPSLNADMKPERFDNLFGQQEMFGGAHPITENAKAMGLLEVLIRRPGPKQITSVFKDYADQASKNPENQASMFGPSKTAADIIKEVVAKHVGIAGKDASKKTEAKEKKSEKAQESMFASDARFILLGYGDDFETLKKSWGYFVGPHGGKYADAAHKVPWKKPVKETGRKKLGKPGKKTTDVKPLKGQVDFYEYKYKIKKEREDKKKKKKDKLKKPVKALPKLMGLKKVRKSLSDAQGAGNSPAGNRAPGPGLGINYVIFVPDRDKGKGTGYRPEAREMMDEFAGDKEGALHVDKEVYAFSESERKVLHFEIPEQYTEAHRLAREGIKERKLYIKEEAYRNARRPNNTVEIEDE